MISCTAFARVVAIAFQLVLVWTSIGNEKSRALCLITKREQTVVYIRPSTSVPSFPKLKRLSALLMMCRQVQTLRKCRICVRNYGRGANQDSKILKLPLNLCHYSHNLSWQTISNCFSAASVAHGDVVPLWRLDKAGFNLQFNLSYYNLHYPKLVFFHLIHILLIVTM